MTAAGVTNYRRKRWEREGQEGEHSRAYEHDSLPLERKHHAAEPIGQVFFARQQQTGTTTAGITLLQPAAADLWQLNTHVWVTKVRIGNMYSRPRSGWNSGGTHGEGRRLVGDQWVGYGEGVPSSAD